MELMETRQARDGGSGAYANVENNYFSIIIKAVQNTLKVNCFLQISCSL